MELVFVVWMIEVVTNIHMWLNLGSLLTVTSIGLFSTIFIALMAGVGEGKDYWDGVKSRIKYLLSFKKTMTIILFFATLGSIWNSLVPSKETAYLMLGAYGVQSAYEVVTESEETKRIAKKSLSIIEEALDKYQKESNNGPKNEKETKVEQGE